MNQKNLRCAAEGPLFTRNFTLLLLGQVCSLAGNGMLRFALSMYVLEQTGSAGIYGGILAVGTALAVVLSPVGGVLADRLDRRKLMVALDGLSGLCALTAALFFSHRGGVWMLGVLSVALAVPAALETPVTQASIPQMHRGGNLIRANAAAAQVQALAGLAAPVLGGLFYGAFGVRAALWTAAVCFSFTAGFECFLQLPAVPGAYHGGHGLAGALRFLRVEQPRAGGLLGLGALANFLVVGLAAVGFPYLVRTVLGMSAQVYGAAEGLVGASALAGSVAASALAGRAGTGRLHLVLVAMGAVFVPACALPLLPGAGARCAALVVLFCLGQALASLFSVFAISALGACTPPAMTGRVMAFTAAAVQAAQPAGQLLYGVLFDTLPGFWVLSVTGAALAVLGALFAPLFRRPWN